MRKHQEIIHFELSPPDGDCSKRVIEVKVWKGSGSKESCGGGRRRKQQTAVDVEGLRDSQPKESCGEWG